MARENLDEDAKRPADNKAPGDKAETVPETSDQKKTPSGYKASRRPNDKKVDQDVADPDNLDGQGKNTPVADDGEKTDSLAPEKAGKAVKAMKEAFENNVPSFKLSDELGSLLESEDLSEDFRERAATVLESAVNVILEAEHSKMVEAFAETLEEALELQESEVENKVQRYVDYVTEEWVKENQLAIEHGIRNEINESVVGEIIDVLERHNIKLDESEIDVMEEERVRAERAENALDEAVDRYEDLKEKLSENQKLLALVHFSRENSLTMVEEQKLFELSKNTVFESGEDFASKLNTLKENFFSESSNKGEADALTEDLNGEVGAEQDTNTKPRSQMDVYKETFRKMSNSNR